MVEIPERPTDLPSYSLPPVDEVVIGLIFMPLGATLSEHIAEYRAMVKDHYPGVQYQPKLQFQPERLTDEVFSPQPPNIQFGTDLIQSGKRTWFVSGDDQDVIQIQEDAFFSNWRKRNNPYPHFESLLKEFWIRFQSFRELVNANSVGLQLQQLEISYINWVPVTSNSLANWFVPANSAQITVDGIPLVPEHQTWVATYLLKQEHQAPFARLHVRQIEALRTGPGTPHVGAQVELNCKVPLPPGVTDDEITDLALRSRRQIVMTFKELTTEKARIGWGEA
jgi:uncharacterized protein (TIGR04255 family)